MEQTDILLGWTCSQSTSVILNLNVFLPLSTCYLIISLFTHKRNDESWTLGYREPNTLNKINLIMSVVSSMMKISEGYSNTRKEELCSIENNDEQILREKSAKSGLQVSSIWEVLLWDINRWETWHLSQRFFVYLVWSLGLENTQNR